MFGVNLGSWNRKVPYGKLQLMQVPSRHVEGEASRRADDMPSAYRSLMEACWEQKPEKSHLLPNNVAIERYCRQLKKENEMKQRKAHR